MDKLPDKIIDIDIIRANYNFKKKCTCSKRSFVLDPANREVHCRQCGQIVEPFEALMDLCNHYERINEQLKSSLEQKRQLDNYKPHLKVIKHLEENYRGKNKMIPYCPVCGEPFYLEELISWSGWEFGAALIEQRKNQKNNDKSNK
ncbi:MULTISPECIES: hypothetical protein [unclassified Clostridium]|uniref:hypothetical protein n=1 Tax=unclassified Clostridium TaxID=2614128 RepID=UPI0002974179|nr:MULTISPECIES: hypothetical protein [unclassified Clostridium]EKQ56212.1 MAG: hypothetical protein A370_02189 [Clostridium sp. Maddingley MBC34-26]